MYVYVYLYCDVMYVCVCVYIYIYIYIYYLDIAETTLSNSSKYIESYFELPCITVSMYFEPA